MSEARLINRKEAADYVGVCADTFDKYVRLGKFPKPIRIGKRKVWDLKAIDETIDIMSGIGSHGIMQSRKTIGDGIDEYFNEN